MKIFKIALLPLLFVLSSCYIYKPYQFKEVTETSDRGGANVLPTAKNMKRGVKGEEAKSKMDPKMEEEILRRQKTQNQELSADSFGRSKGEETAEKSTPQSLKEAVSETDSLKIKIQPNKYYKIKAEGNSYKIQADKWEGDTLVSHILRKPEKVLRFHKDQIDEEALMERRFSKPYSDLITVGAYVAGGAAVLLLVL